MRLVNPFIAGSTPAIQVDSDAAAYISAVQIADGQSLESSVSIAIVNFVTGCKADGIWTAIKASCILAGARTLAGALVPLVGAAPTNVSSLFVSGDYNRETGLLGDGSTKYLDTNRANNADPQNSNHNAVWATSVGTYDGTSRALIGSAGVPGTPGTNVLLHNTTVNGVFARNRSGTGTGTNVAPAAGLIGTNRSASGQYIVRNNSANSTISVTSEVPDSGNVLIYRRGDASSPTYADARIAFYSIGESLDLSLLDSRVSALITAIGAAIP
jgi:hypothetical protein